MLARLLAFVVWALLACCSAYWLLKLWPSPLRVPPQTLSAADGNSGARADLSRLFGSEVSAPVAVAAVESRYQLVGLVAPKSAAAAHAGEGVAVISVDKAPPRSVRVGAPVDGDLVLLALDAKSAALGSQGVVSLRLNLAPPAAPATGSLPTAVAAPVLSLPPPAMQPAPATAPMPATEGEAVQPAPAHLGPRGSTVR
jgi:general secretion pathway protein C